MADGRDDRDGRDGRDDRDDPSAALLSLFIPPEFNAGNAFDFFAQNQTRQLRDPPGRNTVRFFKTRDRNVIGIDIVVRDVSGGLDRALGDAPQDLNRASASTMYTLRRRTLTLNSLRSVNQIGGLPSGTFAGLHHANIFSTTAMGLTAAANVSLWVATGGADPSARTYSPGSAITALVPIVIGGTLVAQRLAVCKAAGAVEILSDLATTPTSAGSMHADTNPCWGLVQTPLNNKTIVGYMKSSLMTTPVTAAIGDAWTTALSNVPAGGYAVGIVFLNGAWRIYWVWPPSDNAAVSVLAAKTNRLAIWSTNLEGTDPQPLVTPLPFVQFVERYGNGLVISDRRNIYWYKGDTESLNLDFARERVLATNREIVCGGLWVDGDELYVLAELWNTADDTGDSAWIEHYDRFTHRWHAMSINTFSVPLTGITSGTSLPMNRLADNYGTRWLYFHGQSLIDRAWHFLQLAPPGMNPFYSIRNDSSSTVGYDYEYQGSGVFTGPELEIEGLEGLPKVLAETWFGGSFSNAGTDATVEIEVATQGQNTLSFTGNLTRTFQQRDRDARQRRLFPDNRDATTRIQYQLTATRSATTRTTPNCVPFGFRFLCFLDGKVKSPGSVLGSKWYKGVS